MYSRNIIQVLRLTLGPFQGIVGVSSYRYLGTRIRLHIKGKINTELNEVSWGAKRKIFINTSERVRQILPVNTINNISYMFATKSALPKTRPTKPGKTFKDVNLAGSRKKYRIKRCCSIDKSTNDS